MNDTNEERLKSRTETAYDEVMNLLTSLGFSKTGETKHPVPKMRLEWWSNERCSILVAVNPSTGNWHAFGDLTPSISLSESLTDISRFVSESGKTIPGVKVARVRLGDRNYLEERDEAFIVLGEESLPFSSMRGLNKSLWQLPQTEEKITDMLLVLGEKKASRKMVDLLKKMIKLRYEYVMFE